MHRSLHVLVLLRVPRTAAVPGRLCSVRFLLDLKTDAILLFDNPMGRIVGSWAKI